VRAGASIADAERAYAARFGDKIVAVPVDDSPVAGPADAPVTIVVWTDFDCPHCRISLPLFEELREKYAPHVRVVHKLYPLRSHPNADGAARAAVAAAKQSRFWAMEKVLFDHQGDLGAAELDRYAELAGLDVARFRVDLASPEVAKVVARDRDEADAAGLDGTPYVVVNGRPVDLGVFHLRDELGPWIEAEIEIAKAKAAPKAAVAR
jgi:protein-disulfide isomerase